ncbi:MAG: hypothetical protein Q7R93_01915 [bacterium]|nr:hypothetical protein [bacterium]
MNTFEPGDKITPSFFGALSSNTNTIVRQGRVVTVETERFGFLAICEEKGSFFSHNFRLVSRFENQPVSPQAQTVLWKKGDKVTPKKGVARSSCENVTIASKQVITVKEVNGNFFLAEECFGIFSALSFTFVRSAESAESLSPPLQRVATRSAPPPLPVYVPPRNVPVRQEPTSRKTIKKKFERETGRTLEWRDGYLCYPETNRKVAGTPHMPNDKQLKKAKDPWD